MLLVNRGAARAHIIIADDAGAATRRAAGELVRYIREISGVTLNTRFASHGPINGDATEICVGRTGRPGEPDVSGLKNDGYIHKTVGNRLFILGENDRAILHAVYAFLEDGLGCRFFTDAVEHIPRRRYLTVAPMDKTVVSPFEYREIFGNVCFHDDEYASKRGLNGQFYQMDTEHGGSIRYQGFVHTFGYFVSPLEYFEEHPEYFSMIDGKRFDGGDKKYGETGAYMVNTQLCLTNPDVVRIVTEKLRKEIEEHPEATIFSVSQNDWGEPCRCPACAAVDEEEGSYAGSLIRFINQVAENIAEDYPHVIIDTLAYRYTRTAPRHTRVAPNVAVRICTLSDCFSHPLRSCDDNWRSTETLHEGNTVPQDMKEWREKCSRMYVWDYVTNFNHYFTPMPNFQVLQDNIQFFLENNVVGLFEQGNGEDLSAEFGELRYYILSKLMWEPNGDVNRWMQEFMAAYYGMGAQPIREYIDAMSRFVTENNIHVRVYYAPDRGYFPQWLIDLADEKFDEAERLADDEDVLERIRRSRMQVKYAKLFNMGVDPDADPVQYAIACEKFLDEVNHFGFTRIREGYPLQGTGDNFRKRIFER